MSFFHYKAIDAKGTVIKGILEGDDLSSAQNTVTARGLFIVQLRESNKAANWFSTFIRHWQVKRTDIIEFSSNLSFMLHAGVPILQALEDIENTIDNRHFKPIIHDIKHNIEAGMRFSDSLKLHQAVIPDILTRLVSVGEETGRLEESLAEISAHLQKVEDLASAVKRALIYPTFALITTFGALIFWLAYVLPKIMELIVNMGVKMPPLTRFLYQASQFTQKFWFLLVLFPVLIFVIIQLMKLRPETRYWWDKAKLRLPIVKLLVYNKLLALFAEQIRLLIMAGIPIDRAFDIVAEVMGNEVFKRAILEAKKNIMAGTRISDALKEQTIFPHLVIRMFTIGETSGSIDDQCAFLGTYYYKIVDDVSEKMGKMIEPILIIILGLIMAVMLAGILLPIYDVLTKLK